MEDLFKELSPFFPSKFHPYSLYLENNVCYFSTLHWGYYLFTFLASVFILYAFIYWEAAYKYANPFKSNPTKVSMMYHTMMLMICVGVGGIITGIPFILYGDDITTVSIDGNKKEIKIYGIIFTETIPFEKINKINSGLAFETAYKKTGNGSTTTTIKITTDISPSHLLVYRLYGKLEGTEEEKMKIASKETTQITQSLNKYLQKMKK